MKAWLRIAYRLTMLILAARVNRFHVGSFYMFGTITLTMKVSSQDQEKWLEC